MPGVRPRPRGVPAEQGGPGGGHRGRSRRDGASQRGRYVFLAGNTFSGLMNSTWICIEVILGEAARTCSGIDCVLRTLFSWFLK